MCQVTTYFVQLLPTFSNTYWTHPTKLSTARQNIHCNTSTWSAAAAALILHKSSEYWATVRPQQIRVFITTSMLLTGGRSGVPKIAKVAQETKQANHTKDDLLRYRVSKWGNISTEMAKLVSQKKSSRNPTIIILPRAQHLIVLALAMLKHYSY